MKFYSWLLRYRLWLGVFGIVLAIAVNIYAGFWPSFILYLLAVVAIASHFFIGPMRLIQQYIEAGDMEGADKILNMIWFVNLLSKLIRSDYYTL